MAYNVEYPRFVQTAGKMTILTAVAGLAVFLVAFVFDVGTQEFNRVSAQTATTTLTVLNTPPAFLTGAYELTSSATTTPTNSDELIEWGAIGNDSNGAPYFLLVCSGNATPTANQAAGAGSLGTAPPNCGTGAIQWGVSAATPSGSEATVSTTTAEGGLFAEVNQWYAWVCDDDPFNPRCNVTPSQGTNATNTSPFHMNQRPVLTDFSNDAPADPGDTITFSSTSSDPDAVGGEDTLTLIVCQTNTDYSTTTNSCATGFLASSTINLTDDVTATYTLASIVRDGTFPAYGYIVDNHGHEAAANGFFADFEVNNVAPQVLGGNIVLNGGSDITGLVGGVETPGYTLDFTITDGNSCVNASSTDEITDFQASIFRSSYGTSTCDGSAGSYDPNYCYPSGVATTTWALSCTASSTSCTGPADPDMLFNCTFPLWFVADPTDAGPNTPAALAADTWSAAVAGIDDDAATGAMATTTAPVDLQSLTALELQTGTIAYPGLAPGDDSGTLSASTSVLSIGNTGLDQEVRGESMCGTFSATTSCAVSASSTIPATQQQFASTSLAYNSPAALTLASTTDTELELDVIKTTSTSTPSSGVTYWGIAVPVSITLAGNYTGLNTFTAVTSESDEWGPGY